VIKEIMKMIKNMTNKIFAILVAEPAIPPNPRKPAMIAMTRKIMEYLNIIKPPLSLLLLYPIP
jgi:hypothetical protein